MAVEILQLNPPSDGDPRVLPPDGWILVDPPHLYLSKLAEQWVDSSGKRTNNVKYYLDHLPAGYRLYQKPRISNPQIIDKHLYGHPGGKYFDSPNRFYPHFAHLMNHGTNSGCPCTICSPRLPAPSASSGHKNLTANDKEQQLPAEIVQGKVIAQNPGNASPAVDEEGTPDTISNLFKRLRLGSIDEKISEPLSMDWMASKDELKNWIAYLKKLPSWMPREGEIVLFIRNLPEIQIDYDNSNETYKEFDDSTKKFVKMPRWEAGVVGQGPSEPVGPAELLKNEGNKEKNITYSGLRLEPLSSLEGGRNPSQKGHIYVPLHHVRPFNFWQHFLRGHSEATWHPTINNALRIMSSVCLVDKYRFRGTWPAADIFCAGIYIGAEFLCVGDTVALIPAPGDAVGDFLEISDIRLRLTHLENGVEADSTNGLPHSSTVLVKGKAFTLDNSRAWSHEVMQRALPKGLAGYRENFYWLHDPSKSLQMPFICISGRCYEAQSMLTWFPQFSWKSDFTQILTYGLDGVKEARSYSSNSDDRILEGKTWFWGDTRLEVLGLESLNNVYASQHDELREEKLDEWRYTNTHKRSRGRPPKLEKHAMAVGLSRALATSGSENETELQRSNAEDDASKKRSFSVAMRDAASDIDMDHDQSNNPFQSDSFPETSTDEAPLEAFKKPKVVVVLDE